MNHVEEFKQLVCGPVCDGDLISKDGRDALVKAGYAARQNGWNFLAAEGVKVASSLGLLSANRVGRPPEPLSSLRMIADLVEIKEIAPRVGGITGEPHTHMKFQERRFKRQSVQVTRGVFSEIVVGEGVETRGMYALVVGTVSNGYDSWCIEFDFYQRIAPLA